MLIFMTKKRKAAISIEVDAIIDKTNADAYSKASEPAGEYFVVYKSGLSEEVFAHCYDHCHDDNFFSFYKAVVVKKTKTIPHKGINWICKVDTVKHECHTEIAMDEILKISLV